MKPEEFNHIILPLRQELLSRAFGMTGNGEDAEDLVQEAMLRLWKRRDSLDASDNIKALFSIRYCAMPSMTTGGGSNGILQPNCQRVTPVLRSEAWRLSTRWR